MNKTLVLSVDPGLTGKATLGARDRWAWRQRSFVEAVVALARERNQ